MTRAFFKTYGDAGFIVLVAVVLVVALLVLIRVIRRSRRATGPMPALPLCPRCGGTGRFISGDGNDWPCLEPHVGVASL